jgi:beta-N-acetylhexosaminidase
MRRAFSLVFLLVLLLSFALPPATLARDLRPRPDAAGAELQGQPADPTPTAEVPPTSVQPVPAAAVILDARTVLDRMTVADKVGQLFLIAFQGNDVSATSDIAVLVRDYRVGGVVLLPSNDNFRSIPVPTSALTDTSGIPSETVSTPAQIAKLAAELQALAYSAPQPINPVAPVTATVPLTGTAPITETFPVTPSLPVTPALALTPSALAPSGSANRSAIGIDATRLGRIIGASANATTQVTRTVASSASEPLDALPAAVPLLLALDWPGDDDSFLSGRGGFTPMWSAMSLGATWSSDLAEQAGEVMGKELTAAGVNLLLGPTLDVLEVPRPGSRGDLDIRTFGGDPFWVGQIGQAFIRGIQKGGGGRVITAANHFPGQGGSDRGPEDEVATVQKSVEQLRQIELAPFSAVTGSGDLSAPGITAALMTSHIRYRGFQGNIRETTPPISLAPQLQDLMELPEFAQWRSGGGVLISDALGVPALRRYYSPTLAEFPHRRIAQDAFLAGNDLLYLRRFSLTEDWATQVAAIKETILFFQEKYENDSAFAARVDAAVARIISLKLRMNNGVWQLASLQRDPAEAGAAVGGSSAVTRNIARAGLTLIYPTRDQLADRMPIAPLVTEKMVIFTDARLVAECASCLAAPVIAPSALQEIILQLYGPQATRQVNPQNIASYTYSDLMAALSDPESAPEVEQAIDDARWIVFAQLDQQPQEVPDSLALSEFLARRSDGLSDKRLVVMGFAAPYYLDTTEISKLTAYFGVYARTAPFLETAVRALFREFTPVGAPPVTVSGINYELIKQLEPNPGQVIEIAPIGVGDVMSATIQVGSQLELETGVILDRKGHPIPDGTPVEFNLRYPAESLALAPQVETTVAGRARTIVALDRPGELWITAQSGEAKNSTRIVLRVGGDSPGTIATVVPTPTPSPTPEPTFTPTHTPTFTPTPEPTSTPEPVLAPLPPPRKPRVDLPAFLAALFGAVLAASAVFAVSRRNGKPAPGRMVDEPAIVAALWATAIAWIAYLLYAVGWMPGSTAIQSRGWTWAAGAIAFVAGLLTLLWTGRKREA